MNILEEEYLQLVIFMLGEEEYGFNINNVKEIVRYTEITRVPKSSKDIEGVINLRGNIIPIIDLRKKFNFETKNINKNIRIIIAEIEDIIVGFIVDKVLEAVKIPIKYIESNIEFVLGNIENKFIEGIAKIDDKLIILLKLDKIIEIK